MNFKIVADSSANLPALAGVSYASVPLKIVTDEKEYVDDITLNTEQMVCDLEAYKGRSGTACPSVGDWLDAFGDAQYVFTIAITSNLSGSHNAALQAKEIYEDTHPDRRVTCLDSLSTGPEMVLIAEKIVELMNEGLDFDTVSARVQEYMGKTHLLFSLESMDNLAKNGRVSKVAAKAAGILGIRVVGKASDVGTLEPMHKPRGEKKAVQLLVKLMTEMGYRGGKVRVSHTYNPGAAEAFTALLQEQFPACDLTVRLNTGLCSYYAEEGGLLVGFETET